MSTERVGEADPRIQHALAELQEIVAERWPAASFVISRGDDPEGLYLDATVDLEDPDGVMDLVVNRLLEMLACWKCKWTRDSPFMSCRYGRQNVPPPRNSHDIRGSQTHPRRLKRCCALRCESAG